MGVPKLSDTQKAVGQINIKAWLQKHSSERKLSLRRLSLMMGRNQNFLYAKISQGDFTGAELVYLGNFLRTNPFDQYRHLLNEHARPSATETTQAARIAELEAQLTATEKERDIYKEVVMRKWVCIFEKK